MTDKKSTAMKIITVINSILILLCFCGCMYILTQKNGIYYTACAATEGLALIFSVLYYVSGYKKDAAKYYRYFLLFYSFTYIVEIAATIIDKNNLGITSSVDSTVIISFILYGNTFLLALGKDLGKKVSYTLCIINLVLFVAPFIGIIVPGLVTFDTAAVFTSNFILDCTWLVMALNALVMTMAKYTDKAIRKGESDL